MSNDEIVELTPLKRALVALDQMQAKLDAAERARREPVAIVGMACRFPGGAHDPASFWQLLVDGRDAVTEVPADRWDIDALYDPDPDAPGKMSSRWGAFLDDVSGFDPQFFGIAPREATSMDPQQRLLLEVAWEALEDAGIAPDTLGGTRTGVFVGMTTSDYAQVQVDANGLTGLDTYYTTGSAHSIASGRLSYVLGLQGPSITLDTACSSSLVAVHLAVQSLRAGESRLALAGGVNLILSPENSIMLSKLRMMAPDGRCKAFDANADGFVRGEGCGLVALKRLSDAVSDGDRVLAIVRGSAVNQDGASGGLTAPNGPSQETVVRDALANGGVAGAEVGYVEAHGTGTALGDPIEVQALAAVLGAGRDPDQPVAIGSVKTNVGHLEAVAGVAGLMKAVLVLAHQEIPPHLHLTELNPHIDWAAMPVVVPTADSPWKGEELRFAGVSAFGFSGTNAHMVLEAVPQAAPDATETAAAVRLLTVSARTEGALRTLAGRYSDHLVARPDLALEDVCATANAGRAHLSHRLTVMAGDRGEMGDRLRAVAAGELPAGAAMRAVTAADPPRVAFLFTGQGAQSPGMAAGLRAAQPVFRVALDRIVGLLDAELATAAVVPPLSRVLFAAPGTAEAALLDQTVYTQASLFALELALVELWRSWGVAPSAMIGHSLGEVVAAVVAGVLSVEDGVRLVVARARLMQALPAGGAMTAVWAPEADTEASVAAAVAAGGVVAVAAVNGPVHTVISGAAADVAALAEACAAQGVRVQPLSVSHAFHSPLMEPMLADFRRALSSLTFHRPRVRVISNVTGAAIGRELADPEYWVQHVLAPVRFADGMATLVAMGFDTFVEIGPHPVLTGMGQECVAPGFGTWVGSLHRQHDDHRQITGAVAALYLAGLAVDWKGVEAPHRRRRVALPTYPFERQPFWVGRHRRPTPRSSAAHPLLGGRLASPLSTTTFEAEMAVDATALLDDHRVFGTAILPATAFVEMALAAGAAVIGEVQLEDLVIHEALAVDDSATVQTIVTPDPSGPTFRIFSSVDGEAWTTHVTGRLRRADPRPKAAPLPLAELRSLAARVVDGATHDERMRKRGLDFGPSLRNVRQVWVTAEDAAGGGGEAIGEVALGAAEAAETSRYTVHPALVDAAIQVLAELAWVGDDTYLPISIDRVTATPAVPAPASAWSHARLRAIPVAGDRPETLTADVTLVDDQGHVLLTIEGLRLKRADPDLLRRAGDGTAAWLYEVAWRPVAPVAGREQALAAADLARAAADAVDRLRDEHDIVRYQGLLDGLEALSTDYIVAALRQLGVRFEPGARFDPADLPVAAHHRRLFEHLLGLLAADGLLRRDAAGWIATRAHTEDVGPRRVDDLLAAYPAGRGELAITQRCGEHLAAALTGAADPVELLFPGGSIENAEQMYQLSPFAHFYNSLAAEAVSAAVSDRPDAAHLRVLEIGAGTGGTSAYVLATLPPDRVEYAYTDVSPHFLGRARQKFAAYPFVVYRTLDIEGEVGAQGFDQPYDIVIAANVLHATSDLQHTFANVSRLLAPGGALVMVEMLRPQRFIAISFGLTEGWWKFTDIDLRPHQLLLDGPGWQRFLRTHGFVDPHVVPSLPVDSPSALATQSVVMATRRLEPAEGGHLDQRWLILADHQVGPDLAALVATGGGRAIVVTPGASFRRLGEDRFELDPTDPTGFEELVRMLRRDGLTHALHLWTLAPAAGATARERAKAPLGSALHLTRALANGGLAPRTCFVTRGAQPAGAPVTAPEAALVWGLAKTVALEYPELAPLCVDLDTEPAPTEARDLLTAIARAGREDQLALRNSGRLAARLTPARPPAVAEPFEVTFDERGSFDDLVRRPAVRRPPAAAEVEIRVHATAINFKDVLNVLGMYPGDPGPLGGECAGTVVAVGTGVTELQIGDRVVALAAGAFRSHATCDARFVARLPEPLSFADGAALPIANVTAAFTLRHVAGLQPGERVLIHAAAGGVGLAAVQLAHQIGAEVYGTAGTDAKRDHLRALGVRYVYDSRSLDFAGEVMADTGGEGVDVVLNSLAGDFVAASLGVLRDGGRFVEIGKRDHLSAERVAADGGVSYHVVDWTGSTNTEPELIRSMIDEALDAAASGTRPALPTRTFGIDDVAAAFRFVAQARHIGKVVVVQPGAAADDPSGIRADGTYLVTGGLRGLGLLTAQHLVSRGARHLVLLGRRPPGPDALAAIEALEAAGARVAVCTGDVAVRADVERALTFVGGERPPLRGVFHCAGALDDATIGHLAWSQVAAVLAAKVDGALLLDELTRDEPLDHFVLYASIASLVGSRGQANHAAANAFLDALAHRRQAAGLPALSIDWGAWSEVGAAADRGVDQRVAQQGIGVISPDQGVAVLDRLLDRSSPQIGVSPVHWPTFVRRYDADGVPPYFAEVAVEPRRPAPGAAAGPGPGALSAQLADAVPERRATLLADFVREQVVRVLGLAGDQIGDQTPLSDLGLDSLMAVELRNLISGALGAVAIIPATLVFDHPTIEAMTRFLAVQVLGTDAGSAPDGGLVPPAARLAPTGALVASMLDDLEDLSDEEIDAQIARRTAR